MIGIFVLGLSFTGYFSRASSHSSEKHPNPDFEFSQLGYMNEPPSIPEINGPTKGNAGTEYTYEFCSSDLEGDDIYYCVDWGDDSGEICVGPNPSNTCISESSLMTKNLILLIQ